jgi:hypothetical protein
MAQRLFLWFVVQIFLFNGEILGQENNVEKFPPSGGNSLVFKQNNLLQVNTGDHKQQGFMLTGSIIRKPVVNFSASSFLQLNPPLAENFYSNHLSFFCRKELQIEKATSIPLRFRLGSLQYTDYLEQKPNATLR